MMKRHALLLNFNPNGSDETLHMFRSFLCSPYGGDWNNNEVKMLAFPRRNVVIDAVKQLAHFDFAIVLVIATGGEAKIDRPWAELYVTGVSGERITERDLNPGCPRCLLIVDGTESDEHADAFRPPEPRSSMHLYEEAVSSAEAGLVKVFAKKTELQPAALIPLLIAASYDWARQAAGILTVSEALARAEALAHAQSRQLSAKYMGGRRLRDFPFCIRV